MAMEAYDDTTPNPFTDDPSPAPSDSHSSPRSRSPSLSHPSPSASPAPPAYPSSGGGFESRGLPASDVASKPFSSPATERARREGGSQISAASGSPPPTHRATFPSPGVKSYVGPKVREGNCCDRDADLQKGVEISIIDAHKTSEGGKGSFITYVIRTGNHETRRRYSAFDSLRSSLLRLYPVLIIPPIPSKQSLADYAVKGQSKAKEDATVIARRIRMLEDFLRRVARHPILSGEHVFHRFLEEGISWNEVLHSPPLSLLPKNPLHAPSHNPTMQAPSGPSQSFHVSSETSETSDAGDGNEQSTHSGPSVAYIAHHLLPSPSASHPLKQPDARFIDSEVFTDKFANCTLAMEKVNRRVVKRWGERATGASELGALLNGFSLDSKGSLQTALEKFGQAVDAEHLSTALLLQQWEQTTTEPLQVYAQYGQIIRQRLAFRHQKHVQHEMVQDALEHQREKLEVLERAEREARRLEEALENGGRVSGLGGSALLSDPNASQEEGGSSMGGSSMTARPRKAGGGGGGLLSAVKHSLSGMMDVDPEATRRANIGKTRDNISQLEDSLQASAQDLKYASTTLQADLDRFQRQKVADLRDLAISLAGIHRDWAKQNLKAWQAAQEAIGAIEPHPNRPPADATFGQAPADPTTSTFSVPPPADNSGFRSSPGMGPGSPSGPMSGLSIGSGQMGGGGGSGSAYLGGGGGGGMMSAGALKRSDTATTVTGFQAVSSPVMSPASGMQDSPLMSSGMGGGGSGGGGIPRGGSFEVKRPVSQQLQQPSQQPPQPQQPMEVRTYEGGPL